MNVQIQYSVSNNGTALVHCVQKKFPLTVSVISP